MDEAGHDHPVPGLLPRLWLPDDQLQPGPGLCIEARRGTPSEWIACHNKHDIVG